MTQVFKFEIFIQTRLFALLEWTISFSLPICPYPVKRTDNAESASNPSNYIPRMQSHLNIAEFGGDKHGAHVPGSHSPDAKRDLRDNDVARQRITSIDLISANRCRFSDTMTQGRESKFLSTCATNTTYTLSRAINRARKIEIGKNEIGPIYIILRVHESSVNYAPSKRKTRRR